MTPVCDDLKNIEAVYASCAKNIGHIATRMSKKLPDAISYGDLVSAGVIGLMDAMGKYDATHNNTFKTYAEFRIRGAMQDELRSLDWMPTSVRKKERELREAEAALELRDGCAPSQAAIAAYLGIDAEEYFQWTLEIRRGKLGHPALTEIRKRIGVDDGDPYFLVKRQSLLVALELALAALPRQEGRVLTLYYSEGLKIREIAEILGVVESRISQIRTKALARLRRRMAKFHDDT